MIRVEIICYSFQTCLWENKLSLFLQCLHSFFLYFEGFLKYVISIIPTIYYWVGQKLCSGVSVPSDGTSCLSPLSPSSGSLAFLAEGFTKPESWWNFGCGDENLKGLRSKRWGAWIIQQMWIEHLWFFQWSSMDVSVGLWWELSAEKFDAFELWCCRRLLRVIWTARRSNQSIIWNHSWVFIGRTDAEAETPIF